MSGIILGNARIVLLLIVCLSGCACRRATRGAFVLDNVSHRPDVDIHQAGILGRVDAAGLSQEAILAANVVVKSYLAGDIVICGRSIDELARGQILILQPELLAGSEIPSFVKVVKSTRELHDPIYKEPIEYFNIHISGGPFTVDGDSRTFGVLQCSKGVLSGGKLVDFIQVYDYIIAWTCDGKVTLIDMLPAITGQGRADRVWGEADRGSLGGEADRGR